MLYFLRGFNRQKDFLLSEIEPQTAFTIVVPFRNEAKNLPTLLRSFSNLKYPKALFEIILVNDMSEDDSIGVINEFLNSKSGKNLKNIIQINDRIISTKSPKKDAITTAIHLAKYDWILTTDADCAVPPYWLDTFDQYIQTNDCVSVSGPVKFTGLSSFLTRFQILDALSLQAVTLSSFGLQKPMLCNGANFAYKLSAFKEVNGFEGNTNSASGDDMFLLEKFKTSFPKQSHFLKSDKAIVTTLVENSIGDLMDQRKRWVSKMGASKNGLSKLSGVIVTLMNVLLIALIPLVLFNIIPASSAGMIVLIKCSVDLLLVFKSARFFEQEGALLSFVFASLLYPFFNLYVVIASLFGTFRWKDRTFSS
ncbi:glycosyltransferase [Winogradskyella maritima]|uniref:Glycosyltransferase n=1 Tax=Winogradskyella maritima TaxID=1517766 RepID=A0ABV8AG42_9FLAO|nr:glycosyltransferase [Winogradskyella maritima]